MTEMFMMATEWAFKCMAMLAMITALFALIYRLLKGFK